jgi:AcrR family transcriptional regulator
MARKRAPTTTKSGGKTGGAASKNGHESVRLGELLQIAAELFAERGYVATTVRDIADAAGILSGSLYHHFESKESMVDEILSSYLDSILEDYRSLIAADLSPRETLAGLIERSLADLRSRRAAIVIYQNESRYLSGLGRFGYLREAALEFERIWVGVIERGVAAGDFRDDIRPRLVYRFIRDAVWATPRWYRPFGVLTPEGIAEQYLSVLLDGNTKR